MSNQYILRKCYYWIKKSSLVLMILFITIITSCNRKPGMIIGGGGREGEVVVVLNEEFKKGRAAEVIDEYLRDSYLLLPQHEPMFDIYYIPWAKFSDPFTGFRNIIKVDINPKYTESKAALQQYDRQVIVTMTAPNSEDFSDLFVKYAHQIVDALSMNEQRFMLEYAKHNVNKKLQQQILDNHQVNVLVPQNYTIHKDTTNFVWMSLEAEKLSLGLILYYFDYTDKNQFQSEYLLHHRDSVLRKYIKGPLYPKRMSHMTTMREPVAPFVKELNYNNNYMIEIKGLWRVTEDFMAGPFLSVAKPDLDGKRIVVLEGYVYYPGENKRKFMRRFEPIVYNFDFPKKETIK